MHGAGPDFDVQRRRKPHAPVNSQSWSFSLVLGNLTTPAIQGVRLFGWHAVATKRGCPLRERSFRKRRDGSWDGPAIDSMSIQSNELGE